MAYWWVNQNKTWRHEIFGEYLWSPKLKNDGNHLQSYDNMTLLEPGDIVFSHYGGALRHVGVVVKRAASSRQPDFGFSTSQWDDDGWSVEMRYLPITEINPQDHLEYYHQVAPTLHAPMNSSGRVNQSYLFAIPDSLGDLYLQFGDVDAENLNDLIAGSEEDALLQESLELVLPDRSLIPTERQALVRARVGQGLFREQVRQIEPACRITGLREDRHLRASHIKPWSASSNAERLDGNNGLMLSPHVDHLFDRGYISFTDSGQVITSKSLEPVVPIHWKLDLNQQGQRFKKSQISYLEYHRDEIFRSA